MHDTRYAELLTLWGTRSVGWAVHRKWKGMAQVLGISVEEAKEFGFRLRGYAEVVSRPPASSQGEVVLEDLASEPPSKPSQQEGQYTHDDAYWHDPKRDVYVIWLPHLPKPLALPAHMWAGIKAAYSQWQGSPSSVEEIARKYGLTRRTITALLRVMSHTHTGSPWTREHVAASEDATLVEDLILAREERVLRQAEAHHWNKIKAKAESWEQLQKGHLDALNDWLTAPTHTRMTWPVVTAAPAKPYIAVLGLTDLHFGALGHDAAKSLRVALDGVLAQIASRGAPHQIVLPIGSDGLHYDTAGYTTTGGTRMEAEGPAREVLVAYLDLVASLVEELSGVAPVYCVPMAGNHDRMMSYATFGAMKLAFRGNDRVTFSESLSDVQVLTYGTTLVALHHGDRHKPGALSGILPRDHARQWGDTLHRYCLMGHYHTPGTFSSKSGLECIYMPSLAPADEWTESQGFRSQPALSVYMFDGTNGLVAIDTVRGSR